MTQVIIQITVANGVRKLYIGQHCLLSTPAVSIMIRELNRQHGDGIILSASHNPGGPDEDFGIKFKGSNGGPALESVTGRIFENTLKISQYLMLDGYAFLDTDVTADYKLLPLEESPYEHSVEVVDNVEGYLTMMKTLFDFDSIKHLLAREDFNVCFDGMHSVAGPYD